MIKKLVKKILSRIKRYLKIFYSFLKYYSAINYINKKIANNNKQGIIPVIIDCELSTLNQYLEPVVEELVKIPGQKFEFYFGEIIRGTGSSYSCYNKKNVFPVEIYQKLKGEMIFLSPHIYPKGPKSALKIVLDHAICSTKFSFHPKEYYENYDIYVVTGEINEQKIGSTLEKFTIQNDIKLMNCGYPKSDKLYQGMLPSANEIFSKLKLNPDKKTLLYAPSWEEGLSMREFGVSLVDTILQDKDINLIIKLHPCAFISSQDYTGGINWEEKFSSFVNYSNCAFIKEFKIDELFAVSDIMITDLSSVALEFLALNKPVIYLDCPKFEETFKNLYKQFNDITYSDLLENPLCNGGRHVGLINYNYKTILKDIYYLYENPDYKRKERDEYSRKLLSNKGCASKKCANMVLEQFCNRKTAVYG